MSRNQRRHEEQYTKPNRVAGGGVRAGEQPQGKARQQGDQHALVNAVGRRAEEPLARRKEIRAHESPLSELSIFCLI